MTRIEKILKSDTRDFKEIDDKTALATLDNDEKVKITVQVENKPEQLFHLTFGVYGVMFAAKKLPDVLLKLEGKSLKEDREDHNVKEFYAMIGGDSYEWSQIPEILMKKFGLKTYRIDHSEEFKKVVNFSLDI